MNERVIEEAKAYINNVFKNNADGHDTNHSIRVYKNACKIAEGYPKSNHMVVSLASLLHDVDDHKLFNTENNINARIFLHSQNVESDMVEFICEVINGVSFSKNKGKHPESIEGKIVQDADRLDAIGAIGIARTFAFGGKKGRSLESSMQHFSDKLLLLKDEMNTEEAKKIAEIRHAYMQGFLSEIREEMES
ncbi:MAG: HD domain-containing protein [Lachnospiraceae bacterium]|nr:HD domain-containing protein [Lachnospiraceae bacterium]MBR1598947.1 HD domain-containing protein [Lachnospiraceae bacterium]